MDADIETEFTACLLAIGPPDRLYIGTRTMLPYSTEYYRVAARNWWNDGVLCRTVSRGEFIYLFATWWGEYKLWLMEQGHGELLDQDYNRCK